MSQGRREGSPEVLAAAGPRRRRTRLRALAMASLAVVLVGGAVAAADANVGGFEGGDGDQAAANCATALDWQCLSSSQYVAALDQPAPNDDVFIGSNKEAGLDSWVIGSGSIGTSKADIQAAWSYSSTNAAHDTNYLDLGFKRASGAGDSYLAFELNQSGAKYVNSAGTKITCRTNGDVIISYEISPSSTVAVHIYKWTWTSGTPCTPGAAGTFGSPVTLPSSAAELAINPASIVNYLSTSAMGTSFPTGTFGEAAIDLTALANAVVPSATCEFFNHLQVTTRSSVSLTSDMEDYLDSGPIAARGCKSGGGGGTPPSVHISAPANDACSSNGKVTLSGTSDQSEVEVVDGNTVVGNAPVDAAGNWTLTLSNVPDGSHSYSAVATDSAGTTTSNTVTVTLSSQGCGGTNAFSTGGSTTGGAGGPGAANGNALLPLGAAASCAPTRLVLTDVFPLGGKTHLLGVAPSARPGNRVTILSTWNHKVVATPIVQRDLSFSATVRLPPASLRLTNRARYVAKFGGQTSLALKFARRLYDTRVQANGTRITFTGVVIRPFAKPVRKVVIRAAHSCGSVARGAIVARVRPSRSGKFSTSFKLPRSLALRGVVFLRAETSVRKVPTNRRTYPTFSLVRGVLAG